MQNLQFKPFDKDELTVKLKEAFPEYKVQTTFGNLQVRKSGFTITGNVALKITPEAGITRTQTNLDMALIFLLVSLPIGIYIYMKAEKTKALENEVVAKLKEILEPVSYQATA